VAAARAARRDDQCIPPFDLALAHELYALLLKPVEQAWRPARNLIVVTNGAFGLLPLSLLPTASVEIRAAELPAASAKRETVIGFGDPLFNAQQVVEALPDQENRAGRAGGDARATASPAQHAADARHRQCRPRPAAAPAGHRQGAQVDRAGTRSRSDQGRPAGQAGDRRNGQIIPICRNIASSALQRTAWCRATSAASPNRRGR